MFPAGHARADGRPLNQADRGRAARRSGSVSGSCGGGAPRPGRVAATIKDWTQCLVHIAISREDGSASERELVATRWHPLWTKNRGWQNAVDIQSGDTLQDDRCEGVRVLSARQEWRVSDSYNLSVPTVHTYFVVIGGTPILVHNADLVPLSPGGLPPAPPGGPPPAPPRPPILYHYSNDGPELFKNGLNKGSWLTDRMSADPKLELGAQGGKWLHAFENGENFVPRGSPNSFGFQSYQNVKPSAPPKFSLKGPGS